LAYIIETIDLVKSFIKRKSYPELIRHPFRREEFTALNRVNLQIEKGEVFGLLGPNGAGKTTLIKILCTLLLPTSGQAFVSGYEVTRQPDDVRRAFGYVISEERSFYWRLTARQNLRFFATLNNLPAKRMDDKVEEVLLLVGLGDRADTPFYAFSTGMRQRLAIARGLLTDPEVVFMDEPTRSLDPPAAQTLRRFVKEELVEKQGKTVFLATHIMEEAEELCDRIAVLNQGQILASGTVPEIRRAVKKHQVYALGVDGVPATLLSSLNKLEGLVSIQPMASPHIGSHESYFRIEFQQNGHSAVPDLVNTVVQAGGRIVAYAPVEEPLSEVLLQVLDGGKNS